MWGSFGAAFLVVVNVGSVVSDKSFCSSKLETKFEIKRRRCCVRLTQTLLATLPPSAS